MSNPQSPTSAQQSRLLWHIDGKSYDLAPFLDSHPGGKDILLLSQGLPDCTPLFNSYHAFASESAIRAKMAEYFVPDFKTPPQLYSFAPDGFYKTLRARVRAHFGARSSDQSVTSRIKANWSWVLRVSLQCVSLVAFWALAFLTPPEWHSREARLAAAFGAGATLISLGFNTMHDASHFALAKGKSRLNSFWLRFWTSLALWSAPLWMVHHSVRHHAFTGNPDLDPDAQHARPFIRKNLETPRKKYVSSWGVRSHTAWAVITGAVFLMVPGMFFGQIFSYWVIWPGKGHLWKMSMPNPKAMRWQWWQPLVTLAVLASFAVNFDPAVLAVYLLACNVTYACCILPDHDSFESVVENHLSSASLADWGEVQVRHSANFKGFYFSQFCGGINYQIEHHLFPSVNHSYLAELSPVVRRTCDEFNVPYVSHSNLLTALWSVAGAVRECMLDGDEGGGAKEE